MLQTEEFDTASTTKIGCYYKLVGYTDKCSAYQAEWSFNCSCFISSTAFLPSLSVLYTHQVDISKMKIANNEIDNWDGFIYHHYIG